MDPIPVDRMTSQELRLFVAEAREALAAAAPGAANDTLRELDEQMAAEDPGTAAAKDLRELRARVLDGVREHQALYDELVREIARAEAELARRTMTASCAPPPAAERQAGGEATLPPSQAAPATREGSAPRPEEAEGPPGAA